jgi:hypothetical protein
LHSVQILTGVARGLLIRALVVDECVGDFA